MAQPLLFLDAEAVARSLPWQPLIEALRRAFLAADAVSECGPGGPHGSP